MALRLHHVALIVPPPLERAIDAYGALFGRGPSGIDAHAAWFALDDGAVRVTTDMAAPQARLVFAAADLAQAGHTLARRGAPGARQPIPVGPDATVDGLVLGGEAALGMSIAVVAAAPWRGDSPLLDGLDHVVIRTSAPDRAAAFYGARLGLDLRLDRTAPEWGARMMFFRCGETILEVVSALGAAAAEPDSFGGLAWRTHDLATAHHAYHAVGLDVSPMRAGRRAGTQVATVRSRAFGAPTLLIGGAKRGAA